jgi:AraC-like DNA-binding protein
MVESHDSPLGRWTTARWSPPGTSPLFGSVEEIWYFDGHLSHAKERVFPDGRAELIVMLDEPHRDGDAVRETRFPAVCINGLRTRPSVVVAPRGRCRVLGIRFHAVGASSLVRASMKHLVDVTIDLRDALGFTAAELGERCADAAETSTWNPARNAAAALHAAAEWALRYINRDASADPVVSWTADVIRKTRGTVSMDAIGAQLGVPRSRVARRFCEYTGITPKLFGRVVRFHNALRLLGRVESIAAAAAELAYYDQAHMYRDFAEFARMTPAAFLSATRYPGSASLAEP